ncbi:DNA recombination protein RmuC [Clostridium aminobutyricum]|uniref:DNA recombination protein RmuC n=2 Tax=Clostridium aminobutyricum TaxID=33953 RepID=A0A939D741_CLOAM|nr:DNA recombination protein RmuC [Clostridium aminobutyricum]
MLIVILIIIALGLIFSLKRQLSDLKSRGNEDLIAELKNIQNQEIQLAISLEKDVKETKQELNNEIKSSRQETLQFVQTSFGALGEMLASNQKDSAEVQDKRLAELNRQFNDMMMQNEQKLEHIRKTMETRISALQEDNSKQLDQMRQTVDEKLQKTLEDRISQSFKLVSERLEQVYRGLGEMQTLASGVGDLKKVLSNVKTRGILGEIQLGAILEQILSPEQYAENINTKPHSAERVEFAIKLPGDDDGVVYLPIDAKFPGDTYSKLVDAYEAGNPTDIEEAVKNLEKAIKKAAKDIHEKYVEPPNTTDFAIMFLPFEGLYAEVVRRGLVEVLQREFKINIAGPTTMAALLNSLQMGFKTLAIQKHSSEVWDVLGAVKTEFDKFGDVLATTQQRITQANEALDKLIGTRTRSIQRKLRGVATLPEPESREILELDDFKITDYDINDEE